MSKNIIRKIIISENVSLVKAMRAMDNAGPRIIFFHEKSEKISSETLALPIFVGLEAKDIKYICDEIKTI